MRFFRIWGYEPVDKGPNLLQGKWEEKLRKKQVLLLRGPSGETILLQPGQGVDQSSVKPTKIYSFPDRLLRVRAFYNDLRQIPSFYLYKIKDNCLNWEGLLCIVWVLQVERANPDHGRFNRYIEGWEGGGILVYEFLAIWNPSLPLDSTIWKPKCNPRVQLVRIWQQYTVPKNRAHYRIYREVSRGFPYMTGRTSR
jgi:hypothetical protein